MWLGGIVVIIFCILLLVCLVEDEWTILKHWHRILLETTNLSLMVKDVEGIQIFWLLFDIVAKDEELLLRNCCGVLIWDVKE